MKRRLINVALVIGGFLVLAAAGQYRADDFGKQDHALKISVKPEDSEYSEVPDIPEEPETLGKTDTQMPEQPPIEAEYVNEDFADVVDKILACGSRNFFRGYPVDEAFVCWLGGTYGRDMLDQLAECLSEGGERDGLWYEMTGRTMHVLWLEYCRAHGFSSYAYEGIIWKEASDPDCIRMDFIGDINLDDRWCTMQTADAAGGVDACIAPQIQEELQAADIVMVNNEFTYTKSDDATREKSYTFKARPENVEQLAVFGTDIVSLANNHTYDYGKKGLLDTLKTLQKAGYPYSGAGKNLAEASRVQYLVIGGRKIAIVSASEIERFYHYTKMAGEQEPGILKTQQENEVLAAIGTARANSDYVIAYIHWGAEGTVSYDARQTALAKKYVDAGVDAVIGGHPHRLQGVTFLNQVPVVYGLGNFWFSTGTLYTTIAQLQIDEAGELSLRLLPCVQKDVKTFMLSDPEEVKQFYHYLADISSNVGIDEDGRFHAYKDVEQPGESPYAYTSGRRYGLHQNEVDMEGRPIDIVGNLK